MKQRRGLLFRHDFKNFVLNWHPAVLHKVVDVQAAVGFKGEAVVVAIRFEGLPNLVNFSFVCR